MDIKKANIFIIQYKVSKGAKIRNRYHQVPHLAQDTNGKVTNSQLDTTNESQEVSPFQSLKYEFESLINILMFNVKYSKKHA